MHSASLYRGIPFIRGLSRSVSPRGIKKKKKIDSCFIHTCTNVSTALFETTRETNSCLTTLIQNVTENRNKMNFDDNRLLWLRNMVSKVRTA